MWSNNQLCKAWWWNRIPVIACIIVLAKTSGRGVERKNGADLLIKSKPKTKKSWKCTRTHLCRRGDESSARADFDPVDRLIIRYFAPWWDRLSDCGYLSNSTFAASSTPPPPVPETHHFLSPGERHPDWTFSGTFPLRFWWDPRLETPVLMLPLAPFRTRAM